MVTRLQDNDYKTMFMKKFELEYFQVVEADEQRSKWVELVDKLNCRGSVYYKTKTEGIYIDEHDRNILILSKRALNNNVVVFTDAKLMATDLDVRAMVSNNEYADSKTKELEEIKEQYNVNTYIGNVYYQIGRRREEMDKEFEEKKKQIMEKVSEVEKSDKARQELMDKIDKFDWGETFTLCNDTFTISNKSLVYGEAKVKFLDAIKGSAFRKLMIFIIDDKPPKPSFEKIIRFFIHYPMIITTPSLRFKCMPSTEGKFKVKHKKTHTWTVGGDMWHTIFGNIPDNCDTVSKMFEFYEGKTKPLGEYYTHIAFDYKEQPHSFPADFTYTGKGSAYKITIGEIEIEDVIRTHANKMDSFKHIAANSFTHKVRLEEVYEKLTDKHGKERALELMKELTTICRI